MRPFIEKLTSEAQGSFISETFTTPQFEVPWHQHVEHELILFLEGHGTSYIGNYVGTFKPGDIFSLGSLLPHTFQKSSKELRTSALVIQFDSRIWGDNFLSLPECNALENFFDKSRKGLRITGDTCDKLAPMMKDVTRRTGFSKLTALFNCLELLVPGIDCMPLSTQEATGFNLRNQERIDMVFRFTIDRFQEPVSLADVAAVAGMSVPAFCNYFRKTTKKTYIDFLHEIRLGYACRQLIDTAKPVQDICYESGFNTLANFNKQFIKLKGMTPSAYRKTFRSTVQGSSVSEPVIRAVG